MSPPSTSSGKQTERTMTDAELDRDWQPNGRRPKSTMARSFSAELMDIFRIENSVTDLDESIDKRKQQVQTQHTELQSLEARIKEMEDRLKRQSVAPAPRNTPLSVRTVSSPNVPPPSGSVSGRKQSVSGGSKHGRGPSRSGASAGRTVGGALPPSPVASDDGRD